MQMCEISHTVYSFLHTLQLFIYTADTRNLWSAWTNVGFIWYNDNTHNSCIADCQCPSCTAVDQPLRVIPHQHHIIPSHTHHCLYPSTTCCISQWPMQWVTGISTPQLQNRLTDFDVTQTLELPPKTTHHAKFYFDPTMWVVSANIQFATVWFLSLSFFLSFLVSLSRTGRTSGLFWWRTEGPLLHAKFHPHRCNDKGVGHQKLKFLLTFDQNVEYKRPAGAYPLRDFHKICRASTAFQVALGIKIWLDLLKGLWSYGGFKLRGSGFPQIFSAP